MKGERGGGRGTGGQAGREVSGWVRGRAGDRRQWTGGGDPVRRLCEALAPIPKTPRAVPSRRS